MAGVDAWQRAYSDQMREYAAMQAVAPMRRDSNRRCLLDHRIGPSEERLRHREPERRRGLQVDNLNGAGKPRKGSISPQGSPLSAIRFATAPHLIPSG